MTRRDFLKRVMTGTVATAALVALPVSVDLARVTVPVKCDYEAYLYWTMKMYCDTPARIGVITNLAVRDDVWYRRMVKS